MPHFLIAALFTFSFTVASAQTVWNTFSSDFSRSYERVTTNFSDFFTLNQPGYAYFGVPAIFAISTPADRFFQHESRNWTSQTASTFKNLGNNYGNGLTPLILATGLYTGGLVFGGDEIREKGRTLTEAMVYATLATQSIKMMAGRSRPYTEQGPYDWGHSSWADDRHFSFPSGHTMAAFTVSTVMAEGTGWAGHTFWYGLAGITAWARITSNKHWFSDTVTGAWIGFTSAQAALNKEEPQLSSSGWKVEPGLSSLSLVYRF